MEGLRKASDSWTHRLGVQPISPVTSHEALPRLEGGTYKYYCSMASCHSAFQT